ncbi:MAG: hypothetical protein LBI72_14905 [Flavobacteriaceae bacterium]|jgi:hypothetical protein|nr:hypothetical protein [Flavobacteriaceae bacterium]
MEKDNLKYRKLWFGVLLDVIGMVSYSIPLLGEFSDVVWAPISAYLLLKMYPGRVGKTGALINFIEELSPGLDFIPSFTLTWVYTYYFSQHKKV